MRGKQGFRQVRNRDNRVIFAGFDADTSNVIVNTATPSSLNAANPATIFAGFQNISLPVNTPTVDLPTIRLATTGDRFALLSYSPDTVGYTPTESQIFVSRDAKKWRTKILPTRNTTDPLKHSWSEVFGRAGRLIVSHGYYPDIVVADNSSDWTLLQNVFAVNGFKQNGIAAGNGMLLAAADDAKVIYRSFDNGITWSVVASNISISDSSGLPTVKTLDSVLALTYGALGATNVFFMLAKRDDVSRFRYVLTSTDGVAWTQRLRIDLGVTGTPQEPLIASSPNRTIIVWNNLVAATTIITTTTGTWTQLVSTPAANWRSLTYDGSKFIACGEPFGTTATGIVMTLNAAATLPTWNVKLTDTQKLRAVIAGASTQPQLDATVTLLLSMTGEEQTFVDSSRWPKQVTAFGSVTQTTTENKWPTAKSAIFSGAGNYLAISGDADLAMGQQDFTIEAWVKLNSYNDATFWESNPLNTGGYRPNGFVWYMTTDGRFRVYRSGADILVTATNVVPLNEWAHIALIRQANKTTIYVNGVARGSTFTTFNDTAALDGVLISRFCDNGNSGINGYIGEFRVTKNIALYTVDFSVPAAPFLNYNPLGAPSNVSVMSARKQLFVSWEPPTAKGDEAISAYLVQLSADSGATWATNVNTNITGNTATISNLINGAAYLVRVAAATEDGVGPYLTTSESVIVGGDQYFDSVILLLHMDGVNGSNTFVNSVANTLTITANETAQISAAQSKFGSAACFFDGSQDFLTLSNMPSGYLNNDFTIEGWVWLNNPAYHQTFFNTAPHAVLSISLDRAGSGYTEVYIGNGSSWINSMRSADSLSYNAWHHIAVVRSGNTVTLYHDGVRQCFINTVPVNVGTEAKIGSLAGLSYNAEFINGYVDEYRITQGVARYSGASFAVPGQFQNDGPLSAPLNFEVQPDNQHVTLSWQRPRATGFVPLTGYNVQYSADNGATWVTATTGAPLATDSTIVGLTNGTSYLFRVAAVNEDGIGPYAVSSPVMPTNGDPLFSSVSLLLFNGVGNTFQDRSGNPSPISFFGSASMSLTMSKWGGNSGYFNGGYITTTATMAQHGYVSGGSEKYRFGTDDFTIEFWAYPVTQTWAGAMINVGIYYDGLLFRQRSGWPYDSLYVNSNSVNWDPSTNMPSNIWTHIALVRESGVISVYSNGTRVFTWNNGANLNSSSAPYITIGAGAHSGFDEPFYGYLDDLRVTKGVARYSGATAAIPTGPLRGAPDDIGPPTNVVAVAGNQSVNLTWLAPATTGVSPLLGYIVQRSSDGGANWTTLTTAAVQTNASMTVASLTNGVTYTFRVAAQNTAGYRGAYSPASNGATPA